MVDYFFIRKRHVELSQLYTGSINGSYWFNAGFNWRAIVVWFVCFAPAIPGLASSINPKIHVGDGLQKYYRGNYVWGKQPENVTSLHQDTNLMLRAGGKPYPLLSGYEDLSTTTGWISRRQRYIWCIQ